MKNVRQVTVPSNNLLLSVQPHYANKILAGEKTIELRRRLPTQLPSGGTAFIYASSPLMQIIGFARIDRVILCDLEDLWRHYSTAACVDDTFFNSYFSGLSKGFALQLSGPHILRHPISLQVMRDSFAVTAPQSYRYAPPHLTDYVISQSCKSS